MRNVVLTILLKDNKYVLQLRSNKVGIPHPGIWGLFGGQLESGEKPITGIVREIKEELNVQIPDEKFKVFTSFSEYHDFYKEEIHYHIFSADFTDFWGKHELLEGQGVDCFTFSELSQVKVPETIIRILKDFHNKNKKT
ncbi:MAG: NUDIX domain-containing protein [Leptospiraceae bacterium]|nr:NUDIX domain-containing protein [Leptospiraceae bacterium]